MSKELNLPITILHEMNGVQYRIGGHLIAVNESADTCTVQFNNGRVEKNISMSDVYINEGYIDKIKQYGKKFANWVVRKVKGLIAFVDGSGKINVNSYCNPVNMLASYSSDETPSCAYFWPSDSLVALAKEYGVNPKVPDFDNVFGVETEEEEYRMGNEMLSRIMNRYATSDDTIEEACQYVNNKYYKTSAVFEGAFTKDTQSEHINERQGDTPPTGVFSVESVPNNIFGVENEGIVVGSDGLRSQIIQSIQKQIKVADLKMLQRLKDAYKDELGDDASNEEYRNMMDEDEKEVFDECLDNIRRTGDARRPLCIWGAPGIGKTAIVKQVIKDMKHDSTLPINLNISYIQCANMDKDAIFLPDLKQQKLIYGGEEDADTMVTMNTTTAAAKCWLPVYHPSGDPQMDEWFEEFYASSAHLIPQKEGGRYVKIRDAEGDLYEGGVIFMDEIARMYPETQHTMMAIADGTLESSVIARSWAVICASNRIQDDPSQDISTTFQPAWNRRFNHVCYVPKFEEWLDWAKGKNSNGRGRIAPELVEFIESGGEKLWYSAVMYGAYDNLLSSQAFKEKAKAKGKNEFVNWTNIEDYMNGRDEKEGMRMLYDMFNKLPDDMNPLKNNRMGWTGADWEQISDEYVSILETMLSNNPIKYTWKFLVKKAVKNGEGWPSQTALREALDMIDETEWADFYKKYTGREYNWKNPENRLDSLRTMISNIMMRKMGSAKALPVERYKEYNDYRAVLNVPGITDGIYNDGLMPNIKNEADEKKRTYRQMDDKYKRNGGLSWKANSERIASAFDYIYTQYPGGKDAAVRDFKDFVSDIADRVAQFKQIYAKNIVSTGAKQQTAIMNALSNIFDCDTTYNENKLKKILTVTADGEDYVLRDISKMSDVAKQFLYNEITSSEFFFHILNLVRYIIHTKKTTTVGAMNEYIFPAEGNEKAPFARDIIQKMLMSDEGAVKAYDSMLSSVSKMFSDNQTAPNPIPAIAEICVICNIFEFMRQCFANIDNAEMKATTNAL